VISSNLGGHFSPKISASMAMNLTGNHVNYVLCNIGGVVRDPLKVT
jgi:hypothetical protein